jgi:hypothetical protein
VEGGLRPNVVGQAILLLLIERFREQARSHSGIGGRQLGIGWLVGRHREQAHSYSWIGCISKRLVGCETVIASSLALTVGLGGVSWGLVGCEAVFASRLAPTVLNLRKTPAAKPPHSTG